MVVIAWSPVAGGEVESVSSAGSAHAACVVVVSQPSPSTVRRPDVCLSRPPVIGARGFFRIGVDGSVAVVPGIGSEAYGSRLRDQGRGTCHCGRLAG